jgi:hypothetical protein
MPCCLLGDLAFAAKHGGKGIIHKGHDGLPQSALGGGNAGTPFKLLIGGDATGIFEPGDFNLALPACDIHRRCSPVWAILVVFRGLAAGDQYRALQVVLELLDFRRRDEDFPFWISSDSNIAFEVIDLLVEGALGLEVVGDEGAEFIGPAELLADGVTVRDEVVLPDDLAWVGRALRFSTFENSMPQQ